MNCDVVIVLVVALDPLPWKPFLITKQYLHGSHAQLICRWWFSFLWSTCGFNNAISYFIFFIQDYKSVCLHTFMYYLNLSDVTIIAR